MRAIVLCSIDGAFINFNLFSTNNYFHHYVGYFKAAIYLLMSIQNLWTNTTKRNAPENLKQMMIKIK